MAVFIFDFAPFSAVLVNCQFYRLNNIIYFFLVDKYAPASSICSDGVIFMFFLTFKGFWLFSLAVLDIQLAELSLKKRKTQKKTC